MMSKRGTAFLPLVIEDGQITCGGISEEDMDTWQWQEAEAKLRMVAALNDVEKKKRTSPCWLGFVQAQRNVWESAEDTKVRIVKKQVLFGWTAQRDSEGEVDTSFLGEVATEK